MNHFSCCLLFVFSNVFLVLQNPLNFETQKTLNFATSTKFCIKAPKKSFRRRRRKSFFGPSPSPGALSPSGGPPEPKRGAPSSSPSLGPLKPKPGPPRAQARAPLEPKPGPPLATNPRTNCTVPTPPTATTKKKKKEKKKKTSACAAWCTLSLCLRATPLAEHFPFGHPSPPNSDLMGGLR